MSNLKLYVHRKQYEEAAGANWPSYNDFIAGIKADPSVQVEIDALVTKSKQAGIRFPIDTATACQSKWTWSTVWLNQLASSSCHRVNSETIDFDNFDSFHNSPKKLDDRQLMLAGKWPTGGCEYCKNIEDAGGFSDRHHNLDIRGLTPPELLTDPTAIKVTPRIIEIFAHNTCNLACTYCNGSLSSKIEQENIKFGSFFKDGVHLPATPTPAAAAAYFDKFMDWLDRNVQSLVRLHLLGGETFIQHDLMNGVLDILERKPNPNLQLCIFSNMNVPDKYWDLYTSRIEELQVKKHIQYFDLTASIDCWGPEQEYVRTGLDLAKFEKRFAWASSQGDWLRLNANQTVTSLTMRTMPDLIERINYYSRLNNKHIGHYFQFYTGTYMFQHPQAFAYSMWADDFKRIYKEMRDPEAIQRMTGLEKQLQQATTHNYRNINKLHVYLDELDRRRNTNWRKLFPYLDINE
jgi:hypothetical protein